MNNNRAKSFVTIMIVIAAASFALRFAAEQIIRFSIAQNEPNAAATLKLISVALENFAKVNKGTYPEKINILTKSTPAYLDKDYTSFNSYKGYVYDCSRLDQSGYSCTALPSICRITGNAIYSVTTGGVFISDSCNKKE